MKRDGWICKYVRKLVSTGWNFYAQLVVSAGRRVLDGVLLHGSRTTRIFFGTDPGLGMGGQLQFIEGCKPTISFHSSSRSGTSPNVVDYLGVCTFSFQSLFPLFICLSRSDLSSVQDAKINGYPLFFKVCFFFFEDMQMGWTYLRHRQPCVDP
jgi:hypothetical protein